MLFTHNAYRKCVRRQATNEPDRYSYTKRIKRIFVDQDGKATWQVHDVVVLPPPVKDREIIISLCLLEGELDPEIVVLARTGIDDPDHHDQYLWAGSADGLFESYHCECDVRE